jgi:plasmid maintenance system antidote protein VapI
VNFRDALHAELAARRRRNVRYSLRAFARFLGVDHSTLSQILRSRRSLSPRMVSRLGRKLGVSSAFIAEARQQQIAEAVLRLARTKSFRPNSRWIATRTGLPLDAVNSALDHLIRHGDLVMESTERWTTTRPAYA